MGNSKFLIVESIETKPEIIFYEKGKWNKQNISIELAKLVKVKRRVRQGKKVIRFLELPIIVEE